MVGNHHCECVTSSTSVPCPSHSDTIILMDKLYFHALAQETCVCAPSPMNACRLDNSDTQHSQLDCYNSNSITSRCLLDPVDNSTD